MLIFVCVAVEFLYITSVAVWNKLLLYKVHIGGAVFSSSTVDVMLALHHMNIMSYMGREENDREISYKSRKERCHC